MRMLRIAKKILLTVLRLTGLLVLTFLAIMLVFYLTAPVYDFNEPQPFSGDYLHNPYDGMDPALWRKYNFQAHSNAWQGITDGRANTDRMIDSIYTMLGFDYVAISDYQHINTYGSEREAYIPNYEHGYGIRKTHQVCLGAEKVLWIDYPFFQTLSHKQGIIDKLNKHCDLVALAHPKLRMGYKLADMKYLSGYALMEVLTNMRVSAEHWDKALTHGHLVYILANDDSHDVLNSKEVGRRFTMINAPDMRRETILQALERGMAYGMDFWRIDDETMEEKAERSKHIPWLQSVGLHADSFSVEVSEPAKAFRFIGKGGAVLQEHLNRERAYYLIQESDPYVRTEIEFYDGSVMYLNPVTRHPASTPERQYLAEINQTRTSLYRGIYIVMLVLLLRGIYRWQLKRASRKP